MSYPAVIQSDSPEWYARLDDLSGTTVTALVGGNGTYFNAPTLGVTGCTNDGDTAVRIASASTQSFNFPNSSFADVFTLECWIKRTTLNATQNALMFIPGNGSYMRIGAGDGIEILQAGGVTLATSTTTITNTTTFHHIVWTKNGATSHIYIDATDVTGTVTNHTFSHISGAVSICGTTDVSAEKANCTFDEVATYTTALSAARVAAHFAAAAASGGPARKSSPGQLVSALAHARVEERKSQRGEGGGSSTQSSHRSRLDYLRRKERG